MCRNITNLFTEIKSEVTVKFTYKLSGFLETNRFKYILLVTSIIVLLGTTTISAGYGDVSLIT